MPKKKVSLAGEVAIRMGKDNMRRLIANMNVALSKARENPAEGYILLSNIKEEFKRNGIVPEIGMAALDKYRRGEWEL